VYRPILWPWPRRHAAGCEGVKELLVPNQLPARRRTLWPWCADRNLSPWAANAAVAQRVLEMTPFDSARNAPLGRPNRRLQGDQAAWPTCGPGGVLDHRRML